MGILQQRTWLGYFALVRILVGFQFFRVAWPKVTGGRFLSEQGQALAENLLSSAPNNPLAWHNAFITGFVVPHAHFFSYLVAFGELSIALSLITGCLVRIACPFGALHNANIFFAIAYANTAQANYNRLLVLLHIVFLCASAGRVFGLDGLLAKRFPRSRLF